MVLHGPGLAGATTSVPCWVLRRLTSPASIQLLFRSSAQTLGLSPRGWLSFYCQTSAFFHRGPGDLGSAIPP